MNTTMKFLKSAYFLIGLSLLFLIPNFLPKSENSLVNLGHTWEQFDPELSTKLHSIGDLLKYTDSVIHAKRHDTSNLIFADELTDVVRKRFYHGYSYYSLRENWIAVLCGSIIWSHLSAIVLPDDILQYPNAACSQQSIVMMECFKRRGIPFRKVGYEHHFALEGMIGGKWYYFDPDLEPDFNIVARNGVDSIFANKEQYIIYKNRLDSASIKSGLANKTFGQANAEPAPRASLFHIITKALSKTMWLLPLCLLYYFKKKSRYKVIRDNEVSMQMKRVS